LTLNSPTLAPFGLTSVYGADPFFGAAVNPSDLRTVNTDFNPTYRAKENIYQARLEQELTDQFSVTATGGYSRSSVDSRTDYTLTAGSPLAGNPGLLALAFQAAQPIPGNPFAVAAQRLIPNGPLGTVCTSETNLNYSGIYGGFTNRCTAAGTEYDRSQSEYRQYAGEFQLSSSFEGPLNFILGANYIDGRFRNANYYVASFGLDYAAGVIGAATTLGQRLAGNIAFPQVYRAPPFFNSEVQNFRLKSTGFYGDATFEASERLKFTAGLRWSRDEKSQVARAPILSFPAIVGVADANTSPFLFEYDADPRTARRRRSTPSRSGPRTACWTGGHG
jgi:hypothetical protein